VSTISSGGGEACLIFKKRLPGRGSVVGSGLGKASEEKKEFRRKTQKGKGDVQDLEEEFEQGGGVHSKAGDGTRFGARTSVGAIRGGSLREWMGGKGLFLSKTREEGHP